MTENEIKELKRRVKENKVLTFNERKYINNALEEIQQYREIGSIAEFKALKEKNEPKKIKGIRFAEAICPKCESELFETYWAFGGIHYCSDCGQKLDWSE